MDTVSTTTESTTIPACANWVAPEVDGPNCADCGRHLIDHGYRGPSK